MNATRIEELEYQLADVEDDRDRLGWSRERLATAMVQALVALRSVGGYSAGEARGILQSALEMEGMGDEPQDGYDPSRVKPDPSNHDCTDFPHKGCRNCGRRDRPQWDGWCNDDICSHHAENDKKPILDTVDLWESENLNPEEYEQT